MIKKTTSIFLCVGVLFFTSCAKNNVSDRDSKREALKAAAEVKREELRKVAGDYSGSTVLNENGNTWVTTLKLTIEDVPTTVEGQTEPVSMPVLTGNMRYITGSGSMDYINFPIQKSDFDLKRKKLDLVCDGGGVGAGSMYVSVVQAANDSLEGGMTAPSSSASGTVKLKRGTAPQISTNGLKGTYQGSFKNTNPSSNLPERVQMTFVTTQDPSQPGGVKITGHIRFYLGPFGSMEYSELTYSDIQYNHFTSKLVAKTTGDYHFTLKSDVSEKEIRGSLFDDALGEVGTLEVNKQ